MSHRLLILRYKAGLWLLKPYLRQRFAKADAELAAETDHNSRRGGYRQGVFSALSDVIRLRAFEETERNG